MVYGCFLPTTAEQSPSNRGPVACKTKIQTNKVLKQKSLISDLQSRAGWGDIAEKKAKEVILEECFNPFSFQVVCTEHWANGCPKPWDTG